MNKEIYVWFRFEKEFLPKEIEGLVIRQLNSGNMTQNACLQPGGTEVLLFDDEDNYFIRVKGQFQKNKYHFSIYTLGIIGLRYRIYLETDIESNGIFTPCEAQDGPDHMFVGDYDLRLINFGSICYIGENKYFFKKEPISGTMSPLYDHFVLTCQNK